MRRSTNLLIMKWVKRLGQSVKRQVSTVVMDRRMKEFLSSLDSELKYYANPRDDVLNARKIVLVLADGKVVGCGGIRREGRVFIIVKESHQKKGVGARLLKKVLEGEEYVTLSVDVNNTAAVRLYEKSGFRPTALYYEWRKADSS